MESTKQEQKQYWCNRWRDNQTGWHLADPHPSLVANLSKVVPVTGSTTSSTAPETPTTTTTTPTTATTTPTTTPTTATTTPQKNEPNPLVFVPLCGKTVDLVYLRNHGYRALGCELSEQAVTEFFNELGEAPRKIRLNENLEKWEVENITIILGNIFDITSLESVGFTDDKVAAVFDRASLVALPDDIRGQYVEHVKKLTHNANQILVTFEHTRPTAPPHSISEELVHKYYDDTYKVEFVSRRNVGTNIDDATYLLLNSKL